jgi:hypothetical protein
MVASLQTGAVMRLKAFLGVSCAALLGSVLVGQTRITPPPNKYSIEQDVKLGQEAAAEARKEFPLMRDDAVTSYVQGLGRRLVDAIPPELQQSAFHYTFDTINVREINAFALPGGPMFVNRGMLEAAATEGEVAGVMAHEISHVVLRHGTAQASKAGKYQAGQIAGAIFGAIIGGRVGSVVAQTTQFGLGAAFMRFGREFEKQADLAGARIMSIAGYDPRDMANMFRTIEKEGGPSGPEWLSDHPNPGNRYEYIVKEAESLPVANPIRQSNGFDRVRAHLKTLPRAPTTAEVAKRSREDSGSARNDAPPSGRVEPPASRYQTYNEGDIFQISVPSNWRELTASNSVTFAPDGAYGTYRGANVFTHGVEVGVARNAQRDLQRATDAFINSLMQSNPRLSQPSAYQNISLDGRRALQASLGNVSDVTGANEVIHLITTQMRDGNLLYAIAVAPQNQFDDYRPTFQRVLGSLRIRN